MRITDVPFSDPTKDRNYRSYKLQFQAPQTVGFYTWKVFLISDTFVGEEVVKDVMVRETFALYPVLILFVLFILFFVYAVTNRRCLVAASGRADCRR